MSSASSSIFIKDGDNLLVRIGSGSISSETGSTTNIVRNPIFDDTGSEWHLESGSVDVDGDGINEWPWAYYQSTTTATASMEVTNSNPYNADSDSDQHIRISIPQEFNSGTT